MSDTEAEFATRRRAMVAGQLRARDIDDERVLEVMGLVPRERFVPAELADQAYEDAPLPIGAGQTISQPYIVALMTQELDVRPGQRVLEVGAGSGYQTAILARLAGEVFAVERIAELAERATAVLAEMGVTNAAVSVGDGTAGLAREAPFDRILCGAAGPKVPDCWVEQLTDGGRIVMPTGGRWSQTLIAAEKRGGKLARRSICGVRFVRLIGRDGWKH